MNPVETLLTETMAERSISRAHAAQWLNTHRPEAFDAAFEDQRAQHMAKLAQAAAHRA